MKTNSRLKITCSVVLFFITTLVFSQDSIRSFEPLPSTSEKLKLILPKAYWFNSYKLKIVNYGVAKIKENGDIYVEASFYEFVENGISIGAVASRGEHSIWLRPGLDSSTKLILCTAMLLVKNF